MNAINQAYSLDPLLCPACGNEYLHHEAALVCNRREDASTTEFFEVSTDGEVSKYLGPSEDNPSERRDAIQIRFSCEHCPHKSVLSVMQHKGFTYLTFG